MTFTPRASGTIAVAGSATEKRWMHRFGQFVEFRVRLAIRDHHGRVKMLLERFDRGAVAAVHGVEA
jgi:hypothetical protein